MSASAKKITPRKSTSLSVILATELPTQLNHKEVRSATQYLIMAHLMRPLVHLNREAQIEGDLADSWKIEDSFKKYTFQISKNAKWSNGDTISAKDIADSIQAQMLVGSTTHFDFRTIQSVDASEHTLKICLKESNPSFLNQLVHPEFGPVKTNPNNDNLPHLSITAGAYSILNASPEEIILIRNPHFPFAKDSSPDQIRLTGTDNLENQLESLKSGAADIVIPMNGVTTTIFTQFVKIVDVQVLDTHFGYTFWLAPNFTSPPFQDIKVRQWLAAKLSALKIDFDSYQPYWNHTRQIFLNDGIGRPTPQELDAAYSKIKIGAEKKVSKIRFLVSSKFPFTKEIVDLLKAEEIEITLDVYQEISEFEKK